MLKKLMAKCSLSAVVCSISLSAYAVAGSPGPVDVPAGELVSALKALARQSDVELVYQPEQLREFHTNGVKGTYSAQEAIAILLKGTELKVYTAASGAMIIAPASTSQAGGAADAFGGALPSAAADAGNLRVAQADGTSSAVSGSDDDSRKANMDEITVFGRGIKTTVRDVPQTVDVYDVNFIENVQATKVTDVVRFTPNAIPTGVSNVLYDDVRARGFPSSFTWNGMARRFASGTLKLANVERVEVLKGPASVLYGPMEPGAIVNLVTKRPQKQFAAAGNFQYGSDNEQHYSADVGGPLSERIGFRLNTAYFQTDTAYEHTGVKDLFIAPIVEFQLAERTLLTVDGYYDRANWPDGYTDGRVPLVGGLVPNPLGRIPLNTNLQYDENITAPEGYGNLGTLYRDIDANARLSHEFTDDLSLNVALSYHRGRNDREQINTGGLDVDNRTLFRTYVIENNLDNKTHIGHVDLKWKFQTAGLTHEAAIGVDHTSVDSAYDYAFLGASPIDIFAPVYGTIVLPDVIPLDHDESSVKIVEAFVQDRVTLGRFHLLGGVRRSKYRSEDDYQVFQGALLQTDLKDQIWSSQFGLVYDATDWLTLFASRNESFVPRLANIFGKGMVVQPERGIQHEIGAKFRLGESGFTGNVALFDIDKEDLLVFDEQHPGFRLPLGGVNSKGFEVSLEGNPAPGLTVYLGYGYDKTEITDADRNVGNSFYHVPEQTFSAYLNYEMQRGTLRGLSITGSLQYVGERWASDDNTYKWPSYTRVDLGVTYPVTERVDVGFNVRNLFESEIYTGFGAVRVARDPFRTVMGTVAFRF